MFQCKSNLKTVIVRDRKSSNNLAQLFVRFEEKYLIPMSKEFASSAGATAGEMIINEGKKMLHREFRTLVRGSTR